MARPWRICFPDAVYHVTARGNNRQSIYLNDHDRQDFLDLLARTHDRYNIRIMAFCLMPNHYHLFMQTPEPNLSCALHWLNATYATRFLRRHRRCGHLFQGRYKSVLVADQAHWLHLSMYIHLNPVRAGIVEEPDDYEWSSFCDYTKNNSRFKWLNHDAVLSAFGPSPRSGRRLYREQCLMMSGKGRWEDFHEAVANCSRELKRDLARKHVPAGQARFVPEFKNAGRTEFDPDKKLAGLATALRTSSDALFQRGNSVPTRLAVYYHLVQNCGLSMTRTGELLGVSVYAVSKGLRRFEGMLERDGGLRSILSGMSNVQT